MMVEQVRALVRPVVTLGVLAAFILGAFVDAGAADTLKEITLVVVAFWFGQRTVNGGDGA